MRSRYVALLLIIGLTLALIPSTTSAKPKAARVKMATLVPDGSIWHKILLAMRAEWKQETEGRVNLVIYPGGVAGDESDVVRKMRIGQLHAAAFSSAGLIDIDEYFNVFAIPLFFDSYKELYHVLKRLEPTLKERLEAKGFVLLNWAFGGWVYFYTKEPVNSVEDLRALKIFVWAGDEQMVQFWKKNDFRPVPLAATDIMTGLQTGMIEAVHTTPLASLSLQWFRLTPFMLDVGIAPLMGANIMTKKAWSKLSQEDQASILEACRKAEARTLAEIPGQDLAAIEAMKKRNVVVVTPDEENMEKFRSMAITFAESMRKSEVPEEIYDRTLRLRDEFRQKKAATEGSQ